MKIVELNDFVIDLGNQTEFYSVTKPIEKV